MKLSDLVGMTAHPSAAKFPYISNDRIKSLAHDISMKGLLDGIVTYEGTVLDGRNRLRALLTMVEQESPPTIPGFGVASMIIDVPTYEYAGTDPDGFVIAKNAQRRQLSSGQRVLSALLFKDYYEKRAKSRQGTRTDLCPNSGTSLEEDEKKKKNRASEDAGEEFGFGKTAWDSGKKLHDDWFLLKKNEDLYMAVWNDTMSLNEADTERKARSKERNEDLKPFNQEAFLSTFIKQTSDIDDSIVTSREHWSLLDQESKARVRSTLLKIVPKELEFLKETLPEGATDTEEVREFWKSVELAAKSKRELGG